MPTPKGKKLKAKKRPKAKEWKVTGPSWVGTTAHCEPV